MLGRHENLRPPARIQGSTFREIHGRRNFAAHGHRDGAQRAFHLEKNRIRNPAAIISKLPSSKLAAFVTAAFDQQSEKVRKTGNSVRYGCPSSDGGNFMFPQKCKCALLCRNTAQVPGIRRERLAGHTIPRQTISQSPMRENDY